MKALFAAVIESEVPDRVRWLSLELPFPGTAVGVRPALARTSARAVDDRSCRAFMADPLEVAPSSHSDERGEIS